MTHFHLIPRLPKIKKVFSTTIKKLFLQTCKFQVGSYSYDMTKMLFIQSNKVWWNILGRLLIPWHAYSLKSDAVSKVQGYVKTTHSVVLDYAVDVHVLNDEDLQLSYGELGNFRLFKFLPFSRIQKLSKTQIWCIVEIETKDMGTQRKRSSEWYIWFKKIFSEKETNKLICDFTSADQDPRGR